MRSATVLLATIALATVGSAASAQDQFSMPQRAVIANKLNFIVQADAQGFTALQRANQLNDRLAYILGYKNLTAANVHVVPAGAYRQIYIGDRKLITVTPADARAEGTTSVDRVTERWVRNLRASLPEARPNANRHLPVEKPAG